MHQQNLEIMHSIILQDVPMTGQTWSDSYWAPGKKKLSSQNLCGKPFFYSFSNSDNFCEIQS